MQFSSNVGKFVITDDAVIAFTVVVGAFIAAAAVVDFDFNIVIDGFLIKYI